MIANCRKMNTNALLARETPVFASILMSGMTGSFGWTSSHAGGMIILPDEGFLYAHQEHVRKGMAPIDPGTLIRLQLIQTLRDRESVETGRQLLQAYAAASSSQMQNSASDCVICMDEKRCITCIPCGHVVYCESCCKQTSVKSSTSCPICRKKVDRMMKIFI